jgi:glutathione synthetase
MSPRKSLKASSSASSAADELVPHIVSFATTHGIVMVSKASPHLLHHAPVSALPSPFPGDLFRAALDLAEPFNLLVDKIARDEAWLLSTLESVRADPFTARLLDLYKESGGPRARQPLCLGIHRSDYMVDEPSASCPKRRLRQIELNTISASFACLSARVSDMHRFLLGGPVALNELDAGLSIEPGTLDQRLPVNRAESALAEALAAAHHAYPPSPHKDLRACVAFIVQDGERNEFDQRHLEFALFAQHKVHVKRLSLGQVHARCAVEDGRLVLDGGAFEISVAYFRAGYRPEDYPGEAEWAARGLIEASLAIKCPSVGYHLAGAKKVQQALAAPGAVERFLSPAQALHVRSCFAGLWSLGPDADASVITAAKREPGRFVLKPQREGGGNNYYNEEVRAQLSAMSSSDLAAHILMERVFPRLQPAALVREGEVRHGLGLSELGVYSVFLGDGLAAPRLCKPAGHLLRTKLDGVDEGGVASGFACLDSPFLV